ncbi:phage portal protein [Curtobacterium flaccumfaciens]|uniref:phage portal protein n=1 Tax=Curtobacterium flaccumfaciens TaxID=2035 RepID=UPI001129C058|nr:phage portal protein [Curtobacterium flaccumfaciens]TPG09390.1 phage portal protein [Curtobacterium flaccumfaciens]
MGLWNEMWKVRETRAEVPPSPNSGDNHTARYIPRRENAPLVVEPNQALSLNAVYSAVSLISTGMKQASLDVYRSNVAVAAPAWVKQPNANQSQRAFIELTTISLATRGNAFWKIDRNLGGQVINVSVLDPRATTVQTDPKTGAVTGYLSGSATLSADQVKHLQLFRRPGETYGLGPVQAAAPDLRSALDTRDFAGDVFGRSGVPTRGYLKTDNQLAPDVAAEARKQWTDAVSDPDGIPIMGSNFDFKSVMLSPKEAQWIESQRFSTTAIARIFHVPASLMLADVEGTSQTYSNVSQAWVEFQKFGMAPYALEIEDALSSLLPGVGVVRFNFEALLRADTQTRYATYAVATWMTKNEIRAIEGLPPIAGGDTLAGPTAPPPAPEDGEADG